MQHEQPLSEQVLAKHGKSFHWASFFLSNDQKSYAQKLYHFCRLIDDIADESADSKLANRQLMQIKQEINLGKSCHHGVQAILTLQQALNLNAIVVEQLIDGVSVDINHQYVQTEDELIRYCYGVAATVGLLMCGVFEIKNENALRYAIDLGVAMQLTNIARDVKTDAKMDRIYIPQDWFNQPISAQSLLTNQQEQVECFKQIQRLLILANKYYRSADHGLCYLPLRARLSILVAARVYESIGLKIQKMNAQQYWQTDRVFTTKLHKIAITMQALATFCTDKRLRQKHQGRQHQLALHSPIEPLAKRAIYGC